MNISIEDIKDYKTICLDEDGDIKGHTAAIANICAIAGMPDITQHNIERLITRTKILKLVNFKIAFYKGEVWWPTDIELQQHIGLSVEAEELTVFEFNEKIISHLYRLVSSTVLRRVSH